MNFNLNFDNIGHNKDKINVLPFERFFKLFDLSRPETSFLNPVASWSALLNPINILDDFEAFQHMIPFIDYDRDRNVRILISIAPALLTGGLAAPSMEVFITEVLGPELFKAVAKDVLTEQIRASTKLNSQKSESLLGSIKDLSQLLINEGEGFSFKDIKSMKNITKLLLEARANNTQVNEEKFVKELVSVVNEIKEDLTVLSPADRILSYIPRDQQYRYEDKLNNIDVDKLEFHSDFFKGKTPSHFLDVALNNYKDQAELEQLEKEEEPFTRKTWLVPQEIKDIRDTEERLLALDLFWLEQEQEWRKEKKYVEDEAISVATEELQNRLDDLRGNRESVSGSYFWEKEKPSYKDDLGHGADDYPISNRDDLLQLGAGQSSYYPNLY